MPKAAILTIGTELLLGKIVDTNGAYLGERLSEVGFEVAVRVSIGDHSGEIRDWIRRLFREVDLIVTTGGLGPTKDDLTRQEVAEALGVPLEFHEPLLEEIKAIFSSRGFHMTENNKRQAYLPRGANPISNPVGTAPAFSFQTRDGKVLVCLPGVPRELKFLMEEKVLPFLRDAFRLANTVKRTRILKICGLGESGVDEQIGDLLKTEGDPFVGVLASPDMIRVLITAVGEGEREVAKKIEPVEREIRRRLGRLIFGVDEETLEGVTVRELGRRDTVVKLEDTATGGEVLRRILRPFEGEYRLEGWMRWESSEGRREKVREICLAVHCKEGGGGEGPKDFEISLEEDGREKRVPLRLGGPKENVESRLAILAIDQLRKWLVFGTDENGRKDAPARKRTNHKGG